MFRDQKDFFPTPEKVAYQMINGYDVSGKTVLEPSAGKCDLVNILQKEGAEVIACEINDDLRKIVQSKCTVIAPDFLTVRAEQISHVQFIFMNPPFSKDEKHVLHAWEIAPAGCTIISLCNSNTIKNDYYQDRKRLKTLVEEFGSSEDLENAFEQAERRTSVDVSIIRLQKPADNYKEEFNGFFLEDDAPEEQENALMPYNVVRDLVNRYIQAIKIFDKQLSAAVELNDMISTFYREPEIGFICTSEKYQANRQQFKKDLQKSAWMYVFDKMNLQKYATRGLKEDINKFVEQQTQIPFTMRNIYQMISIVIGTTEQRMDKAILEVFDKLTEL